MINENIRSAVDYALVDNAAEMKDALYSAIADKVNAAIEQRKIDVAANLFTQNDQVAEVEQSE